MGNIPTQGSCFSGNWWWMTGFWGQPFTLLSLAVLISPSPWVRTSMSWQPIHREPRRGRVAAEESVGHERCLQSGKVTCPICWHTSTNILWSKIGGSLVFLGQELEGVITFNCRYAGRLMCCVHGLIPYVLCSWIYCIWMYCIWHVCKCKCIYKRK